MSFEFFEKLEEKVKQAVDTITLLQMEVEDLKGKNQALTEEAQTIIGENQQLKVQQSLERDRLQQILSRMENI